MLERADVPLDRQQVREQEARQWDADVRQTLATPTSSSGHDEGGSRVQQVMRDAELHVFGAMRLADVECRSDLHPLLSAQR